MVPFSSLPLLVLPAVIEDQYRYSDQSEGKHANIDGMACDVARSVSACQLQFVAQQFAENLRISLDISKSSQESSEIRYHDLKPSSRRSNVMWC